MTQAKHTPGPWTVTQHEMGAFVYCPKNYIISGPVSDRTDGEGNAAIIAAAPELLDVVRDLLSQIRGYQDCNGDKGFVLTDADAVVAKATGSAS